MSASIDPRTRFGPVAARYRRGRPSYPPELVDWVLAQAGLPPRAAAGRAARVADVGCGPGTATRLFAARGYDAVGVDPSAEMLAEARAAGGTAAYVVGEATATGLAPSSADLVVVAQALHWFDLAGALAEFRRILKPGGTCAAFWNERAPGRFEQEYDRLLRRYSREYRDRSHAAPVLAALRAAPGPAGLREARFAVRQQLDRPAFFDRVHSSSYVAHGVDDRAGFEAALQALFERHQRGGRVVIDYETPAVAWRFATRG